VRAPGHRGRWSEAARRLAGPVAIALAVAVGPPAVAQQDATPATAPAADTGPQLAAKAWILVDPLDGAVLAAKGADRPLPIASATKLMTAELALERLKPNQTITAPAYRPQFGSESLIGLRAGEKMTVKDLLYGLILESGNDAAAALATGVAGSVPKFVNQMNRRAGTLGLTNTSYSNPIGFDSPQNYSSAADLAKLAEGLLEVKLFARIADSSSAVLKSGNRPRRIDSRNTLLGRDPTVDGVKTGHTLGAGYVLVGSATRDGTRLISVVLGTGSEAARDAETLKLLDYGFSLYTPEQPVAQGDELASPELDYRDERLGLIARRAIPVSVREGQQVETEVDAPDEVSGDIAEGATLGRVTVSVDGRIAGTSALVAAESVEAATLADKAVATAQNPWILIPAGAIVIVVGLLLTTRGRNSGNGERPPSPKRGRPHRRTPEERRLMHEERMRKRQDRIARRHQR
jgi:serine-type D-Ala-D-Ala carboxypeptidase (penicillin-binding protein 5/6)